MICDKCKLPIRQDYPGYYEVSVDGVNFKFPFHGAYYFHHQCWDWVWEEFVSNKSNDKLNDKSSDEAKEKEMCSHNNLKAISKVEPVEGESNATIEKNTWNVTMRNQEVGNWSFFMGKVYECQDCKEKFVIQSMFKINTE